MSQGPAERLVYMANQIARFFAAQPGDKAPLLIADHLTAFWEPTMRRTIIAHLDEGGAGLDPAATEAVRILKRAPPRAVARAMRAAGEPSTGHRPGDDAG